MKYKETISDSERGFITMAAMAFEQAQIERNNYADPPLAVERAISLHEALKKKMNEEVEEEAQT